MFVKKISLKNFKSFAGANIQFERGFNCLVGPNGSGKTNIIDSLLFAFGESSLKAMRVKKTSDLVFKTSNVAEVSVTFEDDEGKPTEIKRLVRKDGKAKYRLNDKRVKKYVIEDFLAAHQISINNVIKQGEVQRIVEMNPLDRRALVDYIANVSEYEEKKKEALGELDKVEVKLREARTLFAEREGYLKELRQDKENAEKFLKLDARRKTLEATTLWLDVSELEKEFESLVNAVVDCDNKVGAIQKSVSELEARIAEKQAGADGVNKEIVERSQGKEMELQKEVDSLNSVISQCTLIVDERKASIKKFDEKLRGNALEKMRASDEVKGAIARLREQQESLETLTKLIEQDTAALNALYKESSSFSASFQEARRVFEDSSAELFSCKDKLGALQAEVGKQAEIKRLKENEFSRLKGGGEFQDFEEKKKALMPQLREQENLVKELEARLQMLAEEEKKAEARIEALESLIIAAAEKISEKQAVLRNAGEASNRALEAVLELQEKIPGIHGTVQQLCSYSAEYAVPVSIALGNRLNYVVVEDLKTAGKAIDFLKKNEFGRASFIPLREITPPHAASKALLKEKGAVAFVKDLLEYDVKFEKAFSFVCSNTLLTQDLKTAERLVGETRLVTLDGELIEQSGLVTGGYTSKKTNVFLEARELKEWQEKRRFNEAEKTSCAEKLSGLRVELAETRRRKAECELKAKTLQIQLANVEAREEEFLKKQSDLSNALKTLREEATACEKKIGECEEERGALVRRISDLNLRMLAAKEKMDLEKEERLGFSVKEREKKIGDCKIKASELANEINSLDVQKGLFERQLNAVVKEESEVNAELSTAKKELDAAGGQMKVSRAALEEKTREQKKLSGALKDLIDAREAFQKEVTALGNEKGRLQFALDKVGRDKQTSEVRKAVVETKLTDVKARYAAFEGVELIKGKTLEDKPSMLVELKSAQEEIAALGPINLKAIEDFEKRAGELVEQKQRVEQLGNEKEAVIAIITEIEGKKTATFMKTFAAISENFQRLFKQIFVGEGELFLENPEKPFEGGLGIKAQLEGREVKYLELMSGGEKSLLALLFLFAVQACSPSSVYVLDEADAALDQENSRKLVELLKKLSHKTQFLVVTHNETVYKNANCLVGVAMTKQGSQLVEVKLTEAQELINRGKKD